MKRSLIALLSSLVLYGASLAADVNVYVPGSIDGLAEKFTKAKLKLTPVSAPKDGFVPPSPIKYGMLDVPEAIMHDPKEHLVDVGLVINEAGKVEAAVIARSQSRALESAALAMGRGFRFKPASIAGNPVRSYVILPVSYRYIDPQELAKSVEKKSNDSKTK